MNALAFEVPTRLEAHEPPEARETARDAVKLLVARRSGGSISHHRFYEMPEILGPRDLLVVNLSATLPAAVSGTMAGGSPITVHFSTRAPRLEPEYRVVEIRSADGGRPLSARAGERVRLNGGASLDLVARYASGARLMLARFERPARGAEVEDYLARHGRPITYGHMRRRWPLTAYQNVYATRPGSAEMPSAGRPFTRELFARMASRVLVASVLLHAGVSSPELHEAPFPEQFEVPESTARLIAAVKDWGGRVIAVGTTVVRALESAAEDGSVRAASGWTNLVITPERGVNVVDGLITGWHEPEASHLQMLEAIAGHELLERSYEAALDRGYLWHEFGDSHLILP
jgi:S-adenosylmethionine:tRNA ribosyltransferase-isomerase